MKTNIAAFSVFSSIRGLEPPSEKILSELAEVTCISIVAFARLTRRGSLNSRPFQYSTMSSYMS